MEESDHFTPRRQSSFLKMKLFKMLEGCYHEDEVWKEVEPHMFYPVV